MSYIVLYINGDRQAGFLSIFDYTALHISGKVFLYIFT